MSDFGNDYKPCPLCGGKATLRNTCKGHSNDTSFREFMITCDSCGLSTRVVRVTAEVTAHGTVKSNFDELREIEDLWNGERHNE